MAWWSFSAETWALIVILISLILLYGYWPFGFFKRLGVPGPKPVPFFGTMLQYRKGIHNFDMDCFQKYGKIWGIYDARQPVLCVMDFDIIKTIMIKECYSLFTNRRMFGIMKSHSRSLVKNLQKTSERGESVDIKEFFGAYSMDVVTSTAFSVDIDSLNNPKDPFVSNIKKMLKFDLLNPLFLAVALFPFIAPVLEKMDFAFFPIAVTDFFYASLKKIKSERVTKDIKKRVDFMQLMIDSQKPEQAQSKDTNKGPKILLLSLSDIEQVTEVDYDTVMNMEYLDAALSESLRLYPVAPRLERVCKKTVEIKGLTIPKDIVVLIPTYTLHRDPEYWTDPETFNPERFTQENKESIEQYAYMPFGVGPRNCIGMRFAMMTMKLAIVEILQKFDISLSEEMKVPLELNNSGLLAPKHPIKLHFTARKLNNCCGSNHHQG
ncbi:Cytochrome P450 3A27 [Bagarius yarrelli]|uniref:unspecific monooxygenase n=1 Tax=Bagarius yarrelli TaxID=175774 RepID=A0A556VAF6_BAGYA|nr:Cytochrome P450 3A27 [Bagarius yarrelli]